jgi:hypothetical protein
LKEEEQHFWRKDLFFFFSNLDIKPLIEEKELEIRWKLFFASNSA